MIAKESRLEIKVKKGNKLGKQGSQWPSSEGAPPSRPDMWCNHMRCGWLESPYVTHPSCVASSFIYELQGLTYPPSLMRS